jgi:hypothetical protein
MSCTTRKSAVNYFDAKISHQVVRGRGRYFACHQNDVSYDSVDLSEILINTFARGNTRKYYTIATCLLPSGGRQLMDKGPSWPTVSGSWTLPVGSEWSAGGRCERIGLISGQRPMI